MTLFDDWHHIPNLPPLDHNPLPEPGLWNPHNHRVVSYRNGTSEGDVSNYIDELWHPSHDCATHFMMLAWGVFKDVRIELWSDGTPDSECTLFVAYDALTGRSILRAPVSRRIVSSHDSDELFEILHSILGHLGVPLDYQYTGYRDHNFSSGCPHDCDHYRPDAMEASS